MSKITDLRYLPDLDHDGSKGSFVPYRNILLPAWQAVKEEALRSKEGPFAAYKGREVEFVEEKLGIKLWEGEAEMVHSAFNNRLTSVRSCRRAGKTMTLACIVLAAVNIYKAIVISVAPTRRQVQDLLWSHIRSIHHSARVRLLGEPDLLQLRIGPKHFAIGFSTEDPINIMGFHAGATPPPSEDEKNELTKLPPEQWLFMIFDEAPGINQSIFEAVKGSLAGPNTRLILAGNPIMDSTEEHEFAYSHQITSGYHRIKIYAEEAEDPLTADVWFQVPDWLVSEDWIEERAAEWGRDSALFKAHVLGQFAGAESDRRIITLTMLEAAQSLYQPSSTGRHLGVDLARFGADKSVAALWVNGEKRAVHAWNDADLMQSLETILALRTRWGEPDDYNNTIIPIPAKHIHIDSSGLGSGLVDRLKQQGILIDAVDFGSRPRDSWPALTGREIKFRNLRAEMHWVLRRALQEGLARIPKELHNQPCESWKEAQWPEYEMDETAKGTLITVRPKDWIKLRYGKSPDHLDADLLAWCRATPAVRFGVEFSRREKRPR